MIWKESYKIGVEEVDRQHEELFRRFSEYLRAVRGEDNLETRTAKIQETLNFMGEYVVVHFASEEEIQRKYNYPNYAAHREIHERFKAEIQRFVEAFQENPHDEDLIMEFSGKLLTWLINHVAEEDQKIGTYVSSSKEVCQ